MLLAQYGHAPSEKISNGLEANILDGVIFCPTTHSAEKLDEVYKEYLVLDQNKEYFLDNNFYATVLSANKLGKFNSTYPFYNDNLTRKDFTAKNIQKFTSDTLDFQRKLGFSYITSPSVLITSFTSFWSQIAIQMYQETIDQALEKKIESPLLLSLTISETALREEEQFNEFLDTLTSYDVAGFYIIVEAESNTNQNWVDPSTLANYMYLVKVLKNNDYKVYCGYTDLVGFLLKTVGCDGIATGWWKNLRFFTRSRYFKQDGGRPPRKIYTSLPLLNSIYIESELQPISENGVISEVLSKTTYDEILKTNPVSQPWSQETSVLHHWACMKNMLKSLSELETETARIDFMLSAIEKAQSVYIKLKGLDIKFESSSDSNHLRVWRDAISLYKQFDLT